MPASKLVPVALDVLAKHDPQESAERFIEATESRNQQVRQLAWDILGRIDSPEVRATITAGVQAYLDGKLPPDVYLNVLEAAEGKLSDEMEATLIEHGRTLAEADPLGPWLAALEGGDVDRGRKLFLENTKLSCVRCHKVESAGGEVGPESDCDRQAKRQTLSARIDLPAQRANCQGLRDSGHRE